MRGKSLMGEGGDRDWNSGWVSRSKSKTKTKNLCECQDLNLDGVATTGT